MVAAWVQAVSDGNPATVNIMQRTTSTIGVWIAGRQVATGAMWRRCSRQVAMSTVGAVVTAAQPLIFTHFGCGLGGGFGGGGAVPPRGNGRRSAGGEVAAAVSGSDNRSGATAMTPTTRLVRYRQG